jgi:hypothetical protein
MRGCKGPHSALSLYGNVYSALRSLSARVPYSASHSALSLCVFASFYIAVVQLLLVYYYILRPE